MYNPVLTFDIEEWYHPVLLGSHGSGQVPRAREVLLWLLDLLEERKARATFFVLGETLDLYPDIFRRISAAGHELACHGFTHKPLWEHTADSFQKEIRQFKAKLDALLPGQALRGFRASTFSLEHKTAWAVDVLAAEGFLYDSSIFPYRNHVYGVAQAPLVPYRLSSANVASDSAEGRLLELPLPVLNFGKVRLPFVGGFYSRVLPMKLQISLMRRTLKTRPVVLYFHPWEFDPEVPRVPSGRINDWITYTGIEKMRGRMERLLQEFEFNTACQLAEAIQSSLLRD
ncbi:polysaccharide deacetylase family protein [Bdellovibrionota bacterium FG-2]